MAHPKHNYDHPDFYKLIEQLAMNGYNNTEIANELNICPDAFGAMKNGKYKMWTKEENERRSERIISVLTHGRTKINALVRSRYLKSALGGIKTKNTTKRYVQKRCSCEGNNEDCPECGGIGIISVTNKSIIQETDIELPPNMQALSTWLYHHDAEWRKVSEGRSDDKTNRIEGININVSYSKAEDLNLQGIAGEEDKKESE